MLNSAEGKYNSIKLGCYLKIVRITYVIDKCFILDFSLTS